MRPFQTPLRIFPVWVLFILAGCTSPTRVHEHTTAPQWQGRISIHVESTPNQNLTAAFDLQGNAQSGSLTLASPLGTTMANLQWTGQSARLLANGELREFPSLNTLVQHVTGTDLPIESLFSWLQGIPSPALGWSADLSGFENGRFIARRTAPYTPATLKIILDR